MTQSNSPAKQKGFLDLRQQIADVVCNTPSPTDETGQLPVKKSPSTPRPTLHLHHTGQDNGDAATHTTATRSSS